VSLLNRLKTADPKAAEWQHLHDIYLPLIRSWLGRVPGLREEAADLAQEVFLIVARELPTFERRREGAFRSWLRQITVNRLRSYTRQRDRFPRTGTEEFAGFLDQLADPTSDLAQQWDLQHDRFVFQRLLTVAKADLAPSTWQAFQRCGIDGESAASVAADLGISENAVLIAKSRVLKRLRDEAEGLID
jgi:RNA polymerase sigma-70 factor, ECF subfamily